MADRHEQAYRDIQNLRKSSGIKKFLPKAAIERSGLLSKSNIEQIIQCACLECKGHRNLIRRAGGHIQYDEVAEQAHERLISLFALLVYVRKPAFIVPFTWDDVDDQMIVSNLGDGAYICRRKDSFHNIADKDSALINLLDQEIDDVWTYFLRPKIGQPSFRFFGPRFELPIRDLKAMGSGISGNVFAFSICEGYDNIEQFLARKVIKRGDGEERTTLKQLNELNHPHIVRLLATYQHKDHVNLIFPLSNTNLRTFLADPKYGLGQYNFANIFSAPIWKQACGLLDALTYIHKFPEGSEMGIHFDLKPENILVNIRDRSPEFLITDFGLAVIKDLQQYRLSETAGGGDEGYGPPEQTNQNRKYDVWSMGCILLELLYFAIWSFKGAQLLADLRGEPDDPARRYRPFWMTATSEQLPQLRPGIFQAIQNLKRVGVESYAPNKTLRTLSPRNRRFVQRMAVLIENMLWLDRYYRPTSDQAYRDLLRVINDKEIMSLSLKVQTSEEVLAEETPVRGDRNSSITEMRAAMNDTFDVERMPLNLQEPATNEVEVRPDIFRTLYTLLARPNRNASSEDQPVALQMFKQKDSFARITMSPTNEYTPFESGRFELKRIDLIPAYAFREAHNVDRSLAGLRLVPKGLQESYMSYDIDGDLVDLRKAHGALIGHDIMHAAMVDHVRIFPLESKLAGLVPARSRGESHLPMVVDAKGPITIQLWREVRETRRECRLVMYIDNRLILVVSFSHSLTFLSEEKNPFTERLDNRPILPSKLNRKAQPMRLAYIEGRRRDQPDQAMDHPHFYQPALSLDAHEFRRQCLQTQRDFGSIEIEFANFHGEAKHLLRSAS